MFEVIAKKLEDSETRKLEFELRKRDNSWDDPTIHSTGYSL